MLARFFKTEFPFQFIVVSLKDGMFNNANVLFRTKFVDGVSTVSRYTQTVPSNKDHNSLALNNGAQEDNRKKQKRRV